MAGINDSADLLAQLAAWFATQCNGEWEHQHGITLESCDNPGWILKVDLMDTPLQSKPFDPFHVGCGEAGLRCLGFCGQSNSLFCKEEEGRSDGPFKAAAKGSHATFVLRGIQAGSRPIAPGWAFSPVGGGATGTLGAECPV